MAARVKDEQKSIEVHYWSVLNPTFDWPVRAKANQQIVLV
jgi:hypothetical protein